MSVWWLLALGCSGDDPGTAAPPTDGLIDAGLANPFPSSLLVGPDGVDIPLEALPSGGETPIPVDRVAWRSGFSPAQTSVLRLPDLDPATLPTWHAPTPGQGGVVLADLTDGRWLPVFAEIDAWEPQLDPALLIRPLEAVPVGHRVGVAVTTDVVARPAAFDLGSEVVADLGSLGLASDAIAVAWEYPVGDGTRPLRTALDAMTVPGTWAFDRVRNADAGDLVAPLTWRAAEGTFTATSFLLDDRLLDLSDGAALPTGTTEAYLYVHVPQSVKDAPAGSVPVLLFGHGIFGEPSNYLDDADDPSDLLALADEAGFIVVATTWRGLTADDRVEAIEAAGDFGTLPVVADRLVQGQVNTRTLLELVKAGAFVQDPVFAGVSGQVLPDPSRVYYYGISLGAIQGAVLLAQDPPIESAVLHVGGGVWSTMLERSSNWPLFELALKNVVEDPYDRQQLYAFSQLLWDPADPIAWTPELTAATFLLQESIGDEQVPNLTTEIVARSVDLPLATPAVTTPYDVALVATPLPPDSRAFVQMDPEVGVPPDENRPAPFSGAHADPRLWPGIRHQTLDYLLADRVVNHHCGEDPCAASNPGE